MSPFWMVAIVDVVRANTEITPVVMQTAFLKFGEPSRIPYLPAF